MTTTNQDRALELMNQMIAVSDSYEGLMEILDSLTSAEDLNRFIGFITNDDDLCNAEFIALSKKARVRYEKAQAEVDFRTFRNEAITATTEEQLQVIGNQVSASRLLNGNDKDELFRLLDYYTNELKEKVGKEQAAEERQIQIDDMELALRNAGHDCSMLNDAMIDHFYTKLIVNKEMEVLPQAAVKFEEMTLAEKLESQKESVLGLTVIISQTDTLEELAQIRTFVTGIQKGFKKNKQLELTLSLANRLIYLDEKEKEAERLRELKEGAKISLLNVLAYASEEVKREELTKVANGEYEMYNYPQTVEAAKELLAEMEVVPVEAETVTIKVSTGGYIRTWEEKTVRVGSKINFLAMCGFMDAWVTSIKDGLVMAKPFYSKNEYGMSQKPEGYYICDAQAIDVERIKSVTEKIYDSVDEFITGDYGRNTGRLPV